MSSYPVNGVTPSVPRIRPHGVGVREPSRTWIATPTTITRDTFTITRSMPIASRTTSTITRITSSL